MTTTTTRPPGAVPDARATGMLAASGNTIASLHANRSRAMRAALESLPRYVETVDALNAVIEQRETISATRPPMDELVERVINAARQGTFPKDLPAQAAQAEAAFRGSRAVFEALELAGRELAASLNTMVRHQGADAVRRHLHGQLVDILAEVKDQADTVRDVPDAETAIVLGKVEQWQACTSLLGRYSEVRAAQRLFDQKCLNQLPPNYEQASLIGNTLEVFPDWGYFAAGLLTPDADGGRRVIPEAPWPAHPQGFLLWLAESDAQPWVPTAAELTAEGDRLWRARSAAHNETQAEYHKRRLGTSKEV